MISGSYVIELKSKVKKEIAKNTPNKIGRDSFSQGEPASSSSEADYKRKKQQKKKKPFGNDNESRRKGGGEAGDGGGDGGSTGGSSGGSEFKVVHTPPLSSTNSSVASTMSR